MGRKHPPTVAEFDHAVTTAALTWVKAHWHEFATELGLTETQEAMSLRRFEHVLTLNQGVALSTPAAIEYLTEKGKK